MLGKEPAGTKALFIPTAAIDNVRISRCERCALLNGGVYQKQLLFLMKTISEKQMCLLNRIR